MWLHVLAYALTFSDLHHCASLVSPCQRLVHVPANPGPSRSAYVTRSNVSQTALHVVDFMRRTAVPRLAMFAVCASSPDASFRLVILEQPIICSPDQGTHLPFGTQAIEYSCLAKSKADAKCPQRSNQPSNQSVIYFRSPYCGYQLAASQLGTSIGSWYTLTRSLGHRLFKVHQPADRISAFGPLGILKRRCLLSKANWLPRNPLPQRYFLIVLFGGRCDLCLNELWVSLHSPCHCHCRTALTQDRFGMR